MMAECTSCSTTGLPFERPIGARRRFATWSSARSRIHLATWTEAHDAIKAYIDGCGFRKTWQVGSGN